MRGRPFGSWEIRQATVAWFLAWAIFLAVVVVAQRPGVLALVVAVFVLREGYRRWTSRSEKSGQAAPWAYAATMTYAMPGSPAFRNVEEHREAVRRIYERRAWPTDEIVFESQLPESFVEAVRSYFDEPRDEGGAGVGARLPKGPRPLSAAE